MWIGHVKRMLTRTTGLLVPSYKDVADQVVRAHNLGFPVAIHAVEEEAIRTAVNAILNSRSTVIKTLEGESNPDSDNLIFRPIPRDKICLFYSSDAADEEDSVYPGCRCSMNHINK